MNIVILFLLLNLINSGLSMVLYNYQNFNHNLNRLALRYVIFKEKKVAKIFKNIIATIELYHNKSIASVGEGLLSYNELSEDEKTLIETLISLCY